MRGAGQPHTPAALFPGERLGTRFTEGWVGPMADLPKCGNSPPPPQAVDPRPSSL